MKAGLPAAGKVASASSEFLSQGAKLRLKDELFSLSLVNIREF